MLTQERLRELLHYDQDLGWFMWRVTRGPRAIAGSQAGYISRHDGGYEEVQIQVDGRNYGASRLAWLYMTGEWPAVEIDHRDTDSLNNSFSNLREATRVLNGQNKRRARADSASGLIGALRRGGTDRWMSRIRVDGKPVYLGSFPTAQQAHAAYVAAKRRLHEGCTL